MSEIIMIVDVHCVTIWRYLDSTLRGYWVLPSNGNVSGILYARGFFTFNCNCSCTENLTIDDPLACKHT